MNTLRISKKKLFNAINEVVKEISSTGVDAATDATMTPGTGEQYATPKAFKKTKKNSVISENYMPDKYDTEYKGLLRAAQKEINWDKPPRIQVMSALHSIGGTINGINVLFSYHRPHQKWGPHWSFLGLSINYKTDRFNKTNRAFDEEYYRSSELVKKKYPQVPQSSKMFTMLMQKIAPYSEELQRANIKEFQDAINFVKKGKLSETGTKQESTSSPFTKKFKRMKNPKMIDYKQIFESFKKVQDINYAPIQGIIKKVCDTVGLDYENVKQGDIKIHNDVTFSVKNIPNQIISWFDIRLSEDETEFILDVPNSAQTRIPADVNPVDAMGAIEIPKRRTKFESKLNEDWGSSDQSIMNAHIHHSLGKPDGFPGVTSVLDAAVDAVDYYWSDWPEYQTDREALIKNAARRYYRTFFPEMFKGAEEMFSPRLDENQATFDFFKSNGISVDNQPSSSKYILAILKPGKQFVDFSRDIVKEPYILHYIKNERSLYTFAVVDPKTGLKRTVDIQRGNLARLRPVYGRGLKEKNSLNENYSKFKTETKTRSKPEQFHQAVKGIRKKVDEINRIFEYCSQLKKDLAEGDQPFKYGKRTEMYIKKVQESIKETSKKLYELRGKVDEILTSEDYKKAEALLDKIKDTNYKLYDAILKIISDTHPHSYSDIEKINQNINMNEGRMGVDSYKNLQNIVSKLSIMSSNISTNSTIQDPDTKVGLLRAIDEIVNQLEQVLDNLEPDVDTTPSINETKNPEFDRKVKQFVKGLATFYGYSESDAVHAMMQSLERQGFNGVIKGYGEKPLSLKSKDIGFDDPGAKFQESKQPEKRFKIKVKK